MPSASLGLGRSGLVAFRIALSACLVFALAAACSSSSSSSPSPLFGDFQLTAVHQDGVDNPVPFAIANGLPGDSSKWIAGSLRLSDDSTWIFAVEGARFAGGAWLPNEIDSLLGTFSVASRSGSTTTVILTAIPTPPGGQLSHADISGRRLVLNDFLVYRRDQ